MIKEITEKEVKNIYDNATNDGYYNGYCLNLEYESMGVSYSRPCYDNFLYTLTDSSYNYLATVSVLEGGKLHYYLIKTNDDKIVNFFVNMQKMSEIICSVHQQARVND